MAITLVDALMRLSRILRVQNTAASLRWDGHICHREYHTNSQIQTKPELQIYYNSTSGLWAFCSTPDAKDCSNPGDRTFQATPLDQLSRVTGSLESPMLNISALSTSTFLPSISSPTTSAATTDTNSIPQPPYTYQLVGSPGINTGAIVRSVVAPVIVVLLILTGIIYLVRRSKRQTPVLDGLDQAMDQSGYIFTGGKAELDSRVRADLDSRARRPAELEAGNTRAELDGRNDQAELPQRS